MLAVSARAGAIRAHGSAWKAARRRSQHAHASSAEVRGISTMNSSPPVRAITSSARSSSTSSAATRTSTRSPTGWPKRSLIILKWSRSITARLTGPGSASAPPPRARSR